MATMKATQLMSLVDSAAWKVMMIVITNVMTNMMIMIEEKDVSLCMKRCVFNNFKCFPFV